MGPAIARQMDLARLQGEYTLNEAVRRITNPIRFGKFSNFQH